MLALRSAKVSDAELQLIRDSKVDHKVSLEDTDLLSNVEQKKMMQRVDLDDANRQYHKQTSLGTILFGGDLLSMKNGFGFMFNFSLPEG